MGAEGEAPLRHHQHTMSALCDGLPAGNLAQRSTESRVVPFRQHGATL